MRWFLETQDKKIKTSDTVRFVGGGALSDVTCQILADVTGKTVETVDTKTELEKISQKLENLNEMIAQKNSKSRRTLLIIVAVCLIIISFCILLFAVMVAISLCIAITPSTDVAIIGGADGPTSIMIASTGFEWVRVVASVLLALIMIASSAYILRKIKK